MAARVDRTEDEDFCALCECIIILGKIRGRLCNCHTLFEEQMEEMRKFLNTQESKAKQKDLMKRRKETCVCQGLLKLQQALVKEWTAEVDKIKALPGFKRPV